MKKFPLFLLLLAFISCGPSKYIVPVEVCHPSKAGVELTDKVISVIYYDDEDESAIKSKGIAESFAESLEKSYVTPDGDIKVYRLPAGSGQHYASKDSLVSLLMHTGADFVFLFEYQKAMLLALKELGTLDEMQYRYAEATLKEQLRRIVKKKLSCNTVTGGDAND